MELLNIYKKNIFLIIIVSLILVACQSAKNNFYYSTIDDTDNISFKAKLSEIDIYIPQVQILNYNQSEMKSGLYKFFKDRFDVIFNVNKFYLLPEFSNKFELSDKLIDSLENKNFKLIPSQLKKQLTRDKKYSLLSVYKGYHLKKYSQLNIFIIDNTTFEKVYSNYNARLINFDESLKTDEFSKEVFTRFIETLPKSTTTQ